MTNTEWKGYQKRTHPRKHDSEVSFPLKGQKNSDLALGSALASLCLTIPVVSPLSIALGRLLVLGLEAEHIVLLVLTLFVSTLSLVMGRTTMMQGGIHLVIFGAFITISALP